MKPAPYIYVMDRGFVFVGRPRNQKPGDDARFITFDDCGIIRRWGTTQGLGELANKGPLADTIIDREPDGTDISTDDIFRRLPCDEEAWSRWPHSKS